LDLIADKWTALIVGLLSERPHRFGELRRAVEGISSKVLTQNLRDLETDGLVKREVGSARRVTVEYSLTPLGKTLTEPLAAIREWAERHISDIQAANVQSKRQNRR
jgi:DNA-binding HxlR family transcriptional regulator